MVTIATFSEYILADIKLKTKVNFNFAGRCLINTLEILINQIQKEVTSLSDKIKQQFVKNDNWLLQNEILKQISKTSVFKISTRWVTF